MIAEIVIASICLTVGYMIRLGYEHIKKPKIILKDETNELIDEIESCGEMSDVKHIGDSFNRRRQIIMVNGIIIQEGHCRFRDGSWSKYPQIFVKNKAVTLTVEQDDRVHALVNYKHAEYGRQQITERLISK